MNNFALLSKTNQRLVIATIALLIYGYLCRFLGIHFFWESKTIGWMLFWVALISILKQRMEWKKTNDERTISEKIGIGISIFILFIKTSLLFAMPQSDAYKTAKAFIETDKSIADEVGKVEGITIIPLGGLSFSSSNEGKRGAADFNFIIKGSKKFKDYNLQVVKDFDTEWTVLKPE
jgi:hypothetical protein